MKSKRVIFFLSHLTMSIIVTLFIITLVFFVWYPNPLAQAVGVTHIFLMLIAIDMIVGPLFSLIVYKEGKKTLKFDLTVIIAIQIIALCYGIYSIEQGRPAWLVFHTDRFELVRKNEIISNHKDQTLAQFQHVSWFNPQFVSVEFTKDKKQREEDMFIEVLGGISLVQKPERYIDFAQAKIQIQQRALRLKELEQYNSKAEVEKTLAKYPKADAWLPLKANAVDMTVLVNTNTGEVVKIVDLRPWK